MKTKAKRTSAPMVTVPPPTPITVADRVARALRQIERAIEYMKVDNINHTPLWSTLHEARMEAQSALALSIAKLS
jgi:hypothetical protein